MTKHGGIGRIEPPTDNNGVVHGGADALGGHDVSAPSMTDTLGVAVNALKLQVTVVAGLAALSGRAPAFLAAVAALERQIGALAP